MQMISDQERREVAQRMRHEITFMRINREWFARNAWRRWPVD